MASVIVKELEHSFNGTSDSEGDSSCGTSDSSYDDIRGVKELKYSCNGVT